MSQREMAGEPIDRLQSIVLEPSETNQVAGRINPQPLPPGGDKLSAKSE
jgi:hypothetical protein